MLLTQQTSRSAVLLQRLLLFSEASKLNKKLYQHHTGYIGNLKEVKYGTLMKEKSDFAMQLAVKGMIPDTTLGRKQLTRCKIYKNADHKHEAQKPETWEM